MTRAPHQQETRQGVIFRHTSRMLHETRCSWEAFSQELVEHYHATVPSEAREIQFKTDGDIFQCARANAQKVSRFADNRVQARLPVELEEAWVAALTEPYRSECLHDLARRFGLLAVPMPAAGVCAVTAIHAMGSVTREFGQACEALAPIIADGTFGPDDAQHVERAARELEDLIAAATALLSQVRAVKAGA